MSTPITLQISLAPTDLPHAVHTVPHQLRQWSGQVDEILLTVDLHRSPGRFSEAWEERLPGMLHLVHECCASYLHARYVDIDYSEPARAAIGAAYFGGQTPPLKDYRGAPLYSYLFSLDAATHDHVFHVDSDMLFGGGSQTWAAEALAVLASRPEVVACNPLPGPPRADGTLRSQRLDAEPMDSLAFRSPALSTRLFLLDRRRLSGLRLEHPAFRRGVGAWMDGHPRFKPLEEIASRLMAERGWMRLDFLGQATGMWSLHPPWRSRLFYERLPSLITEIETSDIPDDQRGYHDVEDCLVDWTTARPSRRQRIEGHARSLLERKFRQR